MGAAPHPMIITGSPAHRLTGSPAHRLTDERIATRSQLGREQVSRAAVHRLARIRCADSTFERSSPVPR
ncbi:hypothetical protein AU191_12905 [Mycolicibacterium acapulense]|nr:hypothetical protein AU191_12905 [Mycolicibacterium acapulense]